MYVQFEEKKEDSNVKIKATTTVDYYFLICLLPRDGVRDFCYSLVGNDF